MKMMGVPFRIGIYVVVGVLVGGSVYWIGTADSRRRTNLMNEVQVFQDRVQQKIVDRRLNAQLYTHEEYIKLRDGITYGDAIGILGGVGAEIARSNQAGVETVIYSWENADGSNILLTFQQGKLISRAQAGLD